MEAVDDRYTTEQLAAASLDALQERGWGQHNMENERGKVCLLGAIARAVNPSVSFITPVAHRGLLQKLNQVIRAEYPERILACEEQCCSADVALPANACMHALFHFNDDPATTQEEVERVLEKAAAG